MGGKIAKEVSIHVIPSIGNMKKKTGDKLKFKIVQLIKVEFEMGFPEVQNSNEIEIPYHQIH